MSEPREVVIVPGLAVRSYAEPAAEALRASGYRVSLLRAPSWRRTPVTMRRYGEALAAQLDERGAPIDLLVGLSVGSQAAALAASKTSLVERLLLVSPTVDPAIRSWHGLLGRWLAGDDSHSDPSAGQQVGDWAQAGVPRIAVGFFSTLSLPIEVPLAAVSARVTVVHAEHDYLGSLAWATSLAERVGARLEIRSGAAHSWPVNDPGGFVELVDRLMQEGPKHAP